MTVPQTMHDALKMHGLHLSGAIDPASAGHTNILGLFTNANRWRVFMSLPQNLTDDLALLDTDASTTAAAQAADAASDDAVTAAAKQKTTTAAAITTPDLLSLPALARALRVTQGWLRAEAEAGRIPALPAGNGRYLFSRVAVETALTQRAAGAQGAAR